MFCTLLPCAQGGFFSKMKNVFSRQKGPVGAPPGTSSGRLGTASRAAQQANGIMGAPPGSASRRLQTGAAGQKRPTTAVQGAGFMASTLSGGSNMAGPTQFEKKEETYVRERWWEQTVDDENFAGVKIK